MSDIDPPMVTCDRCNGSGKDDRQNDCCGVEYDTDIEMCPLCLEHCGPSECNKCSGSGEIRKNEAD